MGIKKKKKEENFNHPSQGLSEEPVFPGPSYYTYSQDKVIEKMP